MKYVNDNDDMTLSVNGQYIQGGSYEGLKGRRTEYSLNDTIAHTFPKGAVITVSFSATLVGMMPLCQAEGKYSTCDAILDDDGNCPSTKNHVVPEPVLAE